MLASEVQGQEDSRFTVINYAKHQKISVCGYK